MYDVSCKLCDAMSQVQNTRVVCNSDLVWCVVLWFVVSGLQFVVCGLWFVVCGLWFVVCGLWFVVCGLQFAV